MRRAGIEAAFAEQAFAGRKIDDWKMRTTLLDDVCGALRDTFTALRTDLDKQVFIN